MMGDDGGDDRGRVRMAMAELMCDSKNGRG